MLKRAAITLMLATSAMAVAISSPVMAKEDKAQAAPSGKPSKGMNKLAVEIQKLGVAKDWAGIKAKLIEAEAVPDRNSFDNYFISQYRFNAGLETKDDVLIQSGLEGMAGSEFVPADQKPKILRNLLIFADKAKDTTKARTYAEQYLQLVPDDADIQLYAIEQMQKAKDYAGADARLMQYIKTAEAAGKPVAENAYLRLVIGREQSKSPAIVDGLQMLVSRYPTSRNWNYLLDNFKNRTDLSGRTGIDLFRLMNATGALISSAGVIEASYAALDAGLPGDARTFLAKAQAAGLMADRKADAAQLNKSVASAIAGDESPAKQEASASTGDRLASVGQLYLSLGNYAKAGDVFTKAIAKGVRNKNEAMIRLGIAKFMGGDKPAAKTAWASVAGDAKLAELAKYWTLLADSK
jgi:tetratricopeptide (TPR) repeat protein